MGAHTSYAGAGPLARCPPIDVSLHIIGPEPYVVPLLLLFNESFEVRATNDCSPTFQRPRQSPRATQVVHTLRLAAKHSSRFGNAQEVGA
jgi:hypothetical protein